MQPAFQSVQVIIIKKKQPKKENTEWMFSDGVFLNFKCIFFHSHAADMFSVDVPGEGRVSGVCVEAGNTRTRQVCATHAVT